MKQVSIKDITYFTNLLNEVVAAHSKAVQLEDNELIEQTMNMYNTCIAKLSLCIPKQIEF